MTLEELSILAAIEILRLENLSDGLRNENLALKVHIIRLQMQLKLAKGKYDNLIERTEHDREHGGSAD